MVSIGRQLTEVNGRSFTALPCRGFTGRGMKMGDFLAFLFGPDDRVYIIRCIKRSSLSQSLAELEQQLAAVLQQISEVGDFRPGSITGNGGRCGNRNCRCNRPKDPGHDPQSSVDLQEEGQDRHGELC